MRFKGTDDRASYYAICSWLLDHGLPSEVRVHNDDFVRLLYYVPTHDIGVHPTCGPYVMILGCTIRPATPPHGAPLDVSAESILED